MSGSSVMVVICEVINSSSWKYCTRKQTYINLDDCIKKNICIGRKYQHLLITTILIDYYGWGYY